MTRGSVLASVLTTYSVPSLAVDALVARGLVAAANRAAVLDLLEAHRRALTVTLVPCVCGLVVADFVLHQEACLVASGLLEL